MDAKTGQYTGHPVVVTGLGWEVSAGGWKTLLGEELELSRLDLSHQCRPVEFLRVRKTLKLMSKQDCLAVSAAGKALRCLRVDEGELTTGCGVFMSVGYIPFRLDEARELCDHAQEGGQFSMAALTTSAYDVIHPLRAFACLPNMPAHHVATNFNLQGEYFITYPGAAEFYLALGEAVERLKEGSMSYALVGGVADQVNFLVENHYCKIMGEVPLLADGAGFMALELEDRARQRGQEVLARLDSLSSGDAVLFGAASAPLRLAADVYGDKG
jgi:3-oxoacyl-(acyl-carrier-protein) synthase